MNNRQEYVDAAASEKVTLVQLDATKRFINYTQVSGGVYFKVVPHFVIGVKVQDGTDLVEGANASVSTGEYFYDVQTSTLYIHLNDSSDPNLSILISTVRKFYSTHPIALPHDLQDSSFDVEWDGRLVQSPNFKSEIGINQNLVSTIGQGTVKLLNTDGALDEIYDDLVFENQLVNVYSINRKLPLSEARLIFTGIVSDLSYTSEEVMIIVKDQLFTLLDKVPQALYDENDNVNSDVVGRAKRWVYGRVDGLKAQSIDQIGEGYLITGTVSSADPTKEQTKITFNSSNPNNYNSKYILLEKSNARTKYYLWWDVNNTGTDPEVVDRTQIEVNLSSGDGLTEIINKTKDALGGKNFEILNSNDVGVIVFEDDQVGDADNAENVNAPVTVETLVNGTSAARLYGTGTQFLTECSPGDSLTIGTQEFSIESITNDTDLVIDDEVAFPVVSQSATLVPNIPTVLKNREFFIAEHATAELTKTVVNALQFNRVILSDTNGILSGDILEFSSNGERVEVKNVAPNNVVVLRQNLLTLPTPSSAVLRQPIQDVFVNGSRLNNEDYSISNIVGETKVIIDDDAEFNIAPISNFNETFTFTNGSRTVTGPAGLNEFFDTRQFIRPEDPTYSTFYEILAVNDNEIILREPFNEVTITDTIEAKRPNYIGDDTVVSVNLLGRTKDGTPSGEWIQTSAEVSRDIVASIGLTERINETSFSETSDKTPQLVSLSLPLNIESSSPTAKEVIDLMGQSTNCALTLDNDLLLIFTSTLIFSPQNARIVEDSDVVRWSVKSKSGKLYKFSDIRYRHSDIDRFTLESGSKIATKTSRFVDNYVGTSKTIEQSVYLYNDVDAKIFAERILYYNSLALTEITLETDLRLEDLEIGDVVQLEFDRLYKRFGDNTARKKLAAVSGRTVTGDRLVVKLTDYGNTFNKSAFITDNAAPNFLASDSNEKIKNGYITDTQGIVNSDEDTAEINSIS